MITGEVLENFRAGYVHHLADFSSQPASNVIPLCFTSCRHSQRDEQGEGTIRRESVFDKGAVVKRFRSVRSSSFLLRILLIS